MWWIIAGAAVGATTAVISKKRERDQEKADIERQKKNAAAAYGYGKELSDKQYGIQKGEALWQLGMQRRALNEGMGQFTDEYNTHLLARAYGEQDARIQTASGIGASVAYEGMSGTRGNEALQLMRDYAANSTERQIDVQRQQDANTLAGTITDANRSVVAMNHERDSWDPGGYRYGMKDAQDLYNKQMFDLGQSNYQSYIDDINDPTNTFLDYFTAFNQGASSGASMGNSYSNYDWNWNKGFKNK